MSNIPMNNSQLNNSHRYFMTGNSYSIGIFSFNSLNPIACEIRCVFLFSISFHLTIIAFNFQFDNK